MTTMVNSIQPILDYLDELFPSVGCDLHYEKNHELVIAVMLSSQTTDKAVNEVTAILFYKYPSLDDFSKASLSDIQSIIKSLGLYKNKSINIQGIVHDLISRFNYQVPSDKKLLMTLPGVGNKTAGVIRAELFKIPDLPVDTHILRIAKRLKYAKKDDNPLDVETILKKKINEDRWIKSHHQLIHFGRYFCTAKNPKCESCKIRTMCVNKAQ